MKRMNIRHLATLAALGGLTAPAAFAASSWGPSGEASYEEHQAPVVSLYSRAEVQEAYRQAAAGGWLPRTGEVVAESPAELAVAYAPALSQSVAIAPLAPADTSAGAAGSDDGIDPVASADPDSAQPGTYGSPADTQMLVSAGPGHLGDPGGTHPGQPQTPLSAGPDMIANNHDELALSEGEELVASGDAGPTPPIH